MVPIKRAMSIGYTSPVTKILGQVLGTYILVETENGLGLFDQHAAHERILYEEITESFDRKKTHSQKMIFPETLHLNIQENAVIEQHLDAFTQIGFGINDLGGATYSIDALPAILACKTYSVKAGKVLDIMEIDHLIQKLSARENPHTCPHGRPTFFLLTKDEIEKKFKRKQLKVRELTVKNNKKKYKNIWVYESKLDLIPS
jgi:DNA mismatch repair protein MutL